MREEGTVADHVSTGMKAGQHQPVSLRERGGLLNIAGKAIWGMRTCCTFASLTSLVLRFPLYEY